MPIFIERQLFKLIEPQKKKQNSLNDQFSEKGCTNDAQC